MPMHKNESINVEGYGASLEIKAKRPVEPPGVANMLRMLISEIAMDCEGAGARSIGHVKCYLMSPNGSMMADTIGIKYGISVRGDMAGPVTEATLIVNSIVVGMSKRAIEKITLAALEKAAEENGFHFPAGFGGRHNRDGGGCDHV